VAVKAAGYRAAFGLTERVADTGRDSLFAIPRILAPVDADASGFGQLLEAPRSQGADLWADTKRHAHLLYRRTLSGEFRHG
jgi:hypothetical protein